MADLVNPTPEIFERGQFCKTRNDIDLQREQQEEARDPIDNFEVFDLLKDIKDPEHPNSLEQLKVIEPGNITVDDVHSYIKIYFTPTVPHCSMTTLIGLCIRVKLMRCLPNRFKMDVLVTPGSHDQELAVNKQLHDKERVAAALENEALLNVVSGCLKDL